MQTPAQYCRVMYDSKQSYIALYSPLKSSMVLFSITLYAWYGPTQSCIVLKSHIQFCLVFYSAQMFYIVLYSDMICNIDFYIYAYIESHVRSCTVLYSPVQSCVVLHSSLQSNKVVLHSLVQSYILIHNATLYYGRLSESKFSFLFICPIVNTWQLYLLLAY